MPNTPEDIVQGQLEAYNSRDYDRFFSYYAEDCQFYKVSENEREAKRHEGFRDNIRKLFDSSPSLKAEIKSRIVSGSFVVDHERVSGFMGREDPIEAVAVYSVVGAKIQAVWFYG